MHVVGNPSGGGTEGPAEGRRGRAPEDLVVAEFTHQAEAFNRSPVMTTAQTLAALIDMLPAAPGQRWLEVACGPGIIARALAPRVGEVVGIDLTPAMIEVARAEAAAAGLGNLRFVEGDATALPFADASFDGAVTRFSLHHMPEAGRCVAEMARVVRPGGWVAVADHVTSEDPAIAAWHREIERLRDPSHHASPSVAGLRGLGAAAGLEAVTERLEPLAIDYEEWLTRGSGGPANRGRIQALLDQRPGEPCFSVDAGGVLRFVFGRFLWRRPESAR
jgi:SAM-dependent methyltransferase